MTKKVYYIENKAELDEALDKISKTFPCFIQSDFIEMNYSKVEINARVEDLASIERILAPLM